jgi:hypothetical protein
MRTQLFIALLVGLFLFQVPNMAYCKPADPVAVAEAAAEIKISEFRLRLLNKVCGDMEAAVEDAKGVLKAETKRLKAQAVARDKTLAKAGADEAAAKQAIDTSVSKRHQDAAKLAVVWKEAYERRKALQEQAAEFAEVDADYLKEIEEIVGKMTDELKDMQKAREKTRERIVTYQKRVTMLLAKK